MNVLIAARYVFCVAGRTVCRRSSPSTGSPCSITAEDSRAVCLAAVCCRRTLAGLFKAALSGRSLEDEAVGIRPFVGLMIGLEVEVEFPSWSEFCDCLDLTSPERMQLRFAATAPSIRRPTSAESFAAVATEISGISSGESALPLVVSPSCSVWNPDFPLQNFVWELALAQGACEDRLKVSEVREDDAPPAVRFPEAARVDSSESGSC